MEKTLVGVHRLNQRPTLRAQTNAETSCHRSGRTSRRRVVGAEAHDDVDVDGGEEHGDGLHAKEEVRHQQAEGDVDDVLERRVVGEEAEGKADGDGYMHLFLRWNNP